MPDQVPAQNQPTPAPEILNPTPEPKPIPKFKKRIIWAAVSVAILLLLGGGVFGYWKITLNSRSEIIPTATPELSPSASTTKNEAKIFYYFNETIYASNYDGTKKNKIFENTGACGLGAGATRNVFVRDNTIFIQNQKDISKKVITENPADRISHVYLSPDGQKIIYQTQQWENMENQRLLMIDSDGSNKKILIQNINTLALTEKRNHFFPTAQAGARFYLYFLGWKDNSSFLVEPVCDCGIGRTDKFFLISLSGEITKVDLPGEFLSSDFSKAASLKYDDNFVNGEREFSNTLLVKSLDGTTLYEETTAKQFSNNIFWKDDGQKLIYESNDNAETYIVDLSTKTKKLFGNDMIILGWAGDRIIFKQDGIMFSAEEDSSNKKPIEAEENIEYCGYY